MTHTCKSYQIVLYPIFKKVCQDQLMSGRPNVCQAINHRATIRPGYCPIFIYLFYVYVRIIHRLISIDKLMKKK